MNAHEFLSQIGYKFVVSREYDSAEVFLRDDINTSKSLDKHLRTIVLGEKNQFDNFDNAVFLKIDQLKIGLRMRPEQIIVHKTIKTHGIY